MKMGCFFAACRNGSSSHSFGNVQFDDHSGAILIPLPTDVSEDVEVLDSYEIIRWTGYDSVLCLLALRCSQEIDRFCCGSDDPLFFGYDFKTG